MRCYFRKKVSEISFVKSGNAAMNVKSSNSGKFRSKSMHNSAKNTSMICEFFHMSGHLKATCYCIHGYPSWHRLFGKPKPKPKPLHP